MTARIVLSLVLLTAMSLADGAAHPLGASAASRRRRTPMTDPLAEALTEAGMLDAYLNIRGVETEAEAMQMLMNDWSNLLAALGITPGHLALARAWARVERALPKGWDIRGLAHGSPDDETEWVAGAGTMPFWGSKTELRGYGPTPAAALDALAAKLEEQR